MGFTKRGIELAFADVRQRYNQPGIEDGTRADFVHLHNMRCFPGAGRRQGAGERLRIAALEGPHDLDVFVGLVELLDQFLDYLPPAASWHART